MHRTEGTNNDVSSGVSLFKNGPPGTTVPGDWLNSVQEELVNVIVQAGISPLTAATDTRNQLYQALLQISPIPRGYIDGFILSNNALDSNHDIDISVGKARSDTDDLTMSLTSIMTKQIDAVWAVGTNGGGFPSGLGAVAIDTWYHVFAISTATGTIDAGFDTSLTAANLIADAAPSGYSKYRRIGSVLTDGSANIIGFSQFGDEFLWDSPPLDINTTTLGTAAVSYTLSTPLGVKTIAIQNLAIDDPASTTVYISSLDQDDESASFANGRVSIRRESTDAGVGNIRTRTNTSSQIRARSSNANTDLYVGTVGYIDTRGTE